MPDVILSLSEVSSWIICDGDIDPEWIESLTLCWMIIVYSRCPAVRGFSLAPTSTSCLRPTIWAVPHQPPSPAWAWSSSGITPKLSPANHTASSNLKQPISCQCANVPSLKTASQVCVFKYHCSWLFFYSILVWLDYFSK